MAESTGQVPRALTDAHDNLRQILRQNRMKGVPDVPPEFLRGNHTHEGIMPVTLLLEAQLASFPNALDVIANPNHVCFAVEEFLGQLFERAEWKTEFVRRAKYVTSQCGKRTAYGGAKKKALGTAQVDLSQADAPEWMESLSKYDHPVTVNDIFEEEWRTTRVLNGSLGFFTLDAAAQVAFEKWHTECRRIMREADRIKTPGCWAMHQIRLQAEDKPPAPPKSLGPLIEACEFNLPIRDDGLLGAIESASSALMDWVEDHTARPTPEPLTDLQTAILAALDGRALKADDLANEVCGGDRRRLYKRNGIKELTQANMVKNKPTVGYYRPDRPPSDKLAPN